jgi:hypothetical protein
MRWESRECVWPVPQCPDAGAPDRSAHYLQFDSCGSAERVLSQLWQNLQTQYDLEIASKKIGKAVERAVRPLDRPDLTARLK